MGCCSSQNNKFLMLVKMFLEMCYSKDERTVFLKNGQVALLQLRAVAVGAAEELPAVAAAARGAFKRGFNLLGGGSAPALF